MAPSAHTVSRTGWGSILRETYTPEAQRWPSNTRGGLGLGQQGAAFLCPGEAISSDKLGRIRFPGAQTQRSQALGSIWGLHFREKAKLTSLNTHTCTRNLCTLVLGKVCQPKKFNKLPAVSEPVGDATSRGHCALLPSPLPPPFRHASVQLDTKQSWAMVIMECGCGLTQKDLTRPRWSKNNGESSEYQGKKGASVSSPLVKGPTASLTHGAQGGTACQAVTVQILAQPSAISCVCTFVRRSEVNTGCLSWLFSTLVFRTGSLAECRVSSFWLGLLAK